MVKVLIYSSKELYNTSSYEGRAEADLVAYRIDEYDYEVVKNRFVNSIWVLKNGRYPGYYIEREIQRQEQLEFEKEMELD